MGSVVVSEVVHDHPNRFPRSTMLAHTAAYQPPPHTDSSTSSSTPAPITSNPSETTSSASSPPPPFDAEAPEQPTAQQHGPSIAHAATADDSSTPQTQHGPPTTSASSDTSSGPTASPTSTRSRSTPPSPKRIKVKDLHHIQSFVEDDESISSLAATGRIPDERSEELPQYEISDMPVTDVIEMVAGLLTKITSTNDDQAERLHKEMPGPEYGAKMNPLSNCVLAFHGKNVPTISIMSYLTRIQKYCPATYEVFLSLLVYFDRITEKINATPAGPVPANPNGENTEGQSQKMDAEKSHGVPGQSTVASDQREADRPREPDPTIANDHSQEAPPSDYPSPPPSEPDQYHLAHYFVVDSFNIHRLIIAGVTCASKFFSDVFYTNSRYAKVGGLPLHELNNLEIQFLLLNDFRLSIPVEELEAYGTMLVEFYAREVIAQREDRPDNLTA